MSSKYDRKPKPAERQCAAPKISIYQMLLLREEIDKQTGRYYTYGKLERAILEGEINPDDYLGVLTDDER